MARDIEEFLRRAAERRQQQQRQQPVRQQMAQPTPRVREYVEEVEIVETPIDMRQQSVSDHVRSHLSTQDIADHAAHLGERIQNADDVITERLAQKFDHDVGNLEDRPTVTDDAIVDAADLDLSTAAVELMEMFRSPRTMRQAILVSEILRRPSFDD